MPAVPVPRRTILDRSRRHWPPRLSRPLPLAASPADRDAGPDRGALLSRHVPGRHGRRPRAREGPGGAGCRRRSPTSPAASSTGAGETVRGAMVEIWQCDARGIYNHPGDSGQRRRDAAFQGYGRVEVDAGGRYAFRTIRPVAYPGRTPHIHFKVHAPGVGRLTTQMYVAGERQNAADGVLNGIRDRKARESVIVRTGRGRRHRARRPQGHLRHRPRGLTARRGDDLIPACSTCRTLVFCPSPGQRPDRRLGRERAKHMPCVMQFPISATEKAQQCGDDCHESRQTASAWLRGGLLQVD